MTEDKENPTTTDQTTDKTTENQDKIIPQGRTLPLDTIRRTADGSMPPRPRLIIDVAGFEGETPEQARATADEIAQSLPKTIERTMISRDSRKPPEGAEPLPDGEWTLISVEIRDCNPPSSQQCEWQLWQHTETQDTQWIQIPLE